MRKTNTGCPKFNYVFASPPSPAVYRHVNVITVTDMCWLKTRQDDVAKKIVDAVIAADKEDGLGYMEASPFDVGVRGGWTKAGPPHRQRMLRLSISDPGKSKARVQLTIFELV